MHRHLTTPLASEIEEGTHHSRRLARNFAKLGLDDPEDFEINRDLAVASISNGFQSFDQDTPLPSEQPRFQLDPTEDAAGVWSNNDPLPFGDGPGVRASCPQLTKEYWYGDGNPQTMVDVNLCPVAVSVSIGLSYLPSCTESCFLCFSNSLFLSLFLPVSLTILTLIIFIGCYSMVGKPSHVSRWRRPGERC